MPVDCRILEIGVAEGASADWWLSNVVGSGGTYIGVDPFTDWKRKKIKGSEVLQVANTVLDWHRKAVADRKIWLYQQRSDVALSRIRQDTDETFDLIYVDGAHDKLSVVQDMVLSWPLLSVGGIWLFDDYGARNPQVKPAYDAAIGLFGDSVQEMFKNSQVGLKKVEAGFPC